MAEKQILRVSPSLTSDAQYRSISEIPSSHLQPDRVVELLPGEYSLVTTALNNVAIHGLGNKEEVIVHGIQLSNTSSGTLHLRNLTVKGTDAAQESTAYAIEVLESDSTLSIDLDNVVLSNANIGVQNHGSGTVTAEYCDFSGVDKAVRANAAMTFKFCHLTANAYGDSNNAQIQAITVLLSGGAGSNGATTTETVVAAIS